MTDGNGEVRTFEAETMAAALEQVRRELGPTAVILESRQVKARRRWFALRARTLVAVTARPANEHERSRRGAATEPDLEQQMLHRLQRIETILADLARRKKTITPDLPDPLVVLYSELLASDVCEPLASELTCMLRDRLSDAELLDESAVARALAELIAERIEVAGPARYERGRRTILAFVGPTGTGKTTVVAKLAANFRLQLGANVGLLSVDTYRLGAVEQLRTYAEILEVPLRVASSPHQVDTAMAELSACDLILVDTPGRSPRDQMRIKELRAYLQELQPTEVHLVLSATSSAGSLAAAVDGFKCLEPDRLLLSKLDECQQLGSVLSCLATTRMPVSYISYGQEVPEHLVPARAAELAERVGQSLWVVGEAAAAPVVAAA
jgi:flagellar biosynthesis protein FlhF